MPIASRLLSTGTLLVNGAFDEVTLPPETITKTVFLTTTGAGTYTIPSDFQSLVSVEAIGAGGGGGNLGRNGGGGAYAKSTAVTGLYANRTDVYYSVGAGISAAAGGDTWFNVGTNAAPSVNTTGVLAKGGQSSAPGGLGGNAESCVGTTTFSGGRGGIPVGGGSGGGGGGAAGPGGVGGGGGSNNSGTTGRGGGGGGASLTGAGGDGGDGSAVSSGAGGAGGGGTGGGAAVSTRLSGNPGTTGTGGGGSGCFGTSGTDIIGGAGATGSIWTQTSDGATAGPGGGSGGSSGTATLPAAGGNYGGGSSSSGPSNQPAGAQGIIVFTYVAVVNITTRITANAIYATEFDEWTNAGSTVAQRQNSNGNIQLAGIFDEFTGAPVVDSSLQLWLDAGQTSSYPGSGTTWTDLSGNSRNGTLTGGPTYSDTNGGSIIFDGTNDFVQCTGSITATAATFVAWIRRNGSQGQYDGILYSRGTSVTGMNFYTSNQLGYIWNAAVNTYTWNSGLTIPDLAWCMIAVSVTSTSATAYLCQSSGITSATNTVSHGSSTLNDIKIAQDDVGGRFFNGRIATAMIYNRALTANEIQTNFNALRGRYGI